ncbi:MAG TPA: glycoside hydrolase family 48 protein [Mycobacteriales bacterium]|nr:glycoside hydrolase family 48 protein [Mycobacteriales bacterium]
MASASLVLGITGAAPTPALAAGGCRIDYTVPTDWGVGFTGNVTITNTGDPVNGWTLGFTFPGNQQVTNGWNGTYSQTGAAVTVTDVGYNAVLATGASTSTGFNASYSGTNAKPVGFTLNGVPCSGHPAPAVMLTAPSTGADFTAPATIPLAATAVAAAGATISKVEFYDGNLLIATDTTSPYSFDWTGVVAGSYSLTAKAYDSDGLTSDSAPVDVVVNPAPAPNTLGFSQKELFLPRGGSATIDVSVSSQPASPVTVTVARTVGDASITATPASLTFTPDNWNTAQQVTVSAAATAPDAASATFTASAADFTSATFTAAVSNAAQYTQRFMTMYQKIKDPANGYFSPQGIPYHSVETLLSEAPDYGHETTSEAFSFWLWLEATFGQVTENWQPFNDAWAMTEKFIIPSHADQPTNSFYNPAAPASYAPELDTPNQYPSPIDTSVPVGQDPLANELKQTYGTPDIYGMHWLLDVDNVYGYGDTPGGGCELGPTAPGPSFINSYQRGSQESVWETIPQPTCDKFAYGGPNGYLDLFIKDSSYAKQWKYTDAPDADARAVEATYWALTWATAQGNQAQISTSVAKAAKMGDYLRYSMFDKYFKQIGNCTNPNTCPGATGRDSQHYLLSWYYAWGGALDTSAGWAWRIGDGAAHQGYQNPLAAWALSSVPAMEPKSPTAPGDWGKSLERMLEFYQWLQSDEGAIAGGATNSWGGHYGPPPVNDPTFYGMFYDPQPVFHDPPSNQWFGFQAWSMERVAEYYYQTSDPKAKAVLDKWVAWASANTTVGTGGDYQIPSTLTWSGAPQTWDPTNPQPNTGLHVQIQDFTQDVGVTAALAKTLEYYAARSGDTASRDLAKALLDAMWAHSDDLGVSVTETKADFSRVDDPFDATTGQGLFVPAGFSGTMPNGDAITPSSTFLSIRSWYKNDPQWSKVQTYLDGGPAPTFNYHRFWAEADVAMANADFGMLFPGD